MSEKTIDSLPEELLIEVFKFLDKESLKEVVLTCKKWKKICEPNVSWSLAMGTWRSKEATININNLQASTRNYTSLTLFNGLNVSVLWSSGTRPRRTRVKIFSVMSQSRMVVALQKIGSNIETLNVWNISGVDYQHLVEFLKLFPKVKQIALIVKLGSELEEIGVVEDPPQFRNLSELYVDLADNLLGIFKNAQLNSLTVNGYLNGSDPATATKCLTNFLSSQRDLKKLQLRCFDTKTKLPVDKAMIPFELKELFLSYDSLLLEELQSLKNFLELQSKSIEILEIVGFVCGGCPDIIELVFAKFKKLKTLELSWGFSTEHSSLYDRLEVNTSVTTLKMYGCSALVKKLSKFLPNIENLALFGKTERESLAAIAENLKKLKTLRIDDYSEINFIQVYFPLLEPIDFRFVDFDLNLMQYVNLFAPELKHLFIDRSHQGSYQRVLKFNVAEILQNFELESLIINGVIDADRHFFDLIRQHGSSLKLLNLNKQSLVSVGPTGIQMGELADIRSLRFHDEPIEDPYLKPIFHQMI